MHQNSLSPYPGWFLFPIQPGTKVPYPGTRGHLDATDDGAAIAAFPPGCNLGVDLERSGLVVLDVDIAEGKHGARAVAEIGDLPESLIQRTGRGGVQVFFAAGDATPGRRVNLPTPTYPKDSGLDLFGKGYVLLPPSRLEGEAFAGAAPGADGGYRWLAPGVAPAPLPPTLRRFLPARSEGTPDALPGLPSGPAPATVIHAARARLRRHGPAVAGRGGNAHTRAAWGILIHGFALTETEALGLLLEWNRGCSPPWDLAELQRGPARRDQTWGGAYGADRLEVLGAEAAASILEGVVETDRLPETDQNGDPLPETDLFGDLLPPPEPLTPWQEAMAWARAQVAAAIGSGTGPRDSAPLFGPGLELLQRTFAPTPWLVQGLITEGGTTMVGGEPKTSKTWVLCEIALSLATGSPVFGTQGTGSPRRIAYFFAEDDARAVRSRFLSLAASKGIAPETAFANLYLCPRGRFLDLAKDEDLALVIASCRILGTIDAIIMEPLRDLHSGEEDKSDSIGPLFKRLRSIGEIVGAGQGAPCTPIVAHHMKKIAADGKPGRGGQRLRGSGAMHGSVDSGLYLSDLKAEIDESGSRFVNTIESEIKAARGMGVFELSLDIRDDASGTAISAAWSIDRSDSPARTAALQEAEDADFAQHIVTLLRAAPERYMSQNNIEKGLRAGGVKTQRKRLGDLIRRLMDRGVLQPITRHPLQGHPIALSIALGPQADGIGGGIAPDAPAS